MARALASFPVPNTVVPRVRRRRLARLATLRAPRPDAREVPTIRPPRSMGTATHSHSHSHSSSTSSPSADHPAASESASHSHSHGDHAHPTPTPRRPRPLPPTSWRTTSPRLAPSPPRGDGDSPPPRIPLERGAGHGKTLFVDAYVAGVAGDMFVAALLDLGVPSPPWRPNSRRSRPRRVPPRRPRHRALVRHRASLRRLGSWPRVPAAPRLRPDPRHAGDVSTRPRRSRQGASSLRLTGAGGSLRARGARGGRALPRGGRRGLHRGHRRRRRGVGLFAVRGGGGVAATHGSRGAWRRRAQAAPCPPPRRCVACAMPGCPRVRARTANSCAPGACLVAALKTSAERWPDMFLPERCAYGAGTKRWRDRQPVATRAGNARGFRV